MKFWSAFCFSICFLFSDAIAQQNSDIFLIDSNCSISKYIAEKEVILILYSSIYCRACFDQLNEYFKKHEQQITKSIFVGIIGDQYSSLEKRIINNSLRVELLPDVDFKTVYLDRTECSLYVKTQKEFPAILTTINNSNELILYPYKFLFEKDKINLPLTYLQK